MSILFRSMTPFFSGVFGHESYSSQCHYQEVIKEIQFSQLHHHHHIDLKKKKKIWHQIDFNHLIEINKTQRSQI